MTLRQLWFRVQMSIVFWLACVRLLRGRRGGAQVLVSTIMDCVFGYSVDGLFC